MAIKVYIQCTESRLQCAVEQVLHVYFKASSDDDVFPRNGLSLIQFYSFTQYTKQKYPKKAKGGIERSVAHADSKIGRMDPSDIPK